MAVRNQPSADRVAGGNRGKAFASLHGHRGAQRCSAPTSCALEECGFWCACVWFALVRLDDFGSPVTCAGVKAGLLYVWELWTALRVRAGAQIWGLWISGGGREWRCQKSKLYASGLHKQYI